MVQKPLIHATATDCPANTDHPDKELTSKRSNRGGLYAEVTHRSSQNTQPRTKEWNRRKKKRKVEKDPVWNRSRTLRFLRCDRANDLAFDFAFACLGSLRNCVERRVVVRLLRDFGNQFGVGDFAVSVNDNHRAAQEALERSVD